MVKIEKDLAIASHQFLPNLAQSYHYPNEGMRDGKNEFEKRVKNFVTIT